MKFIRSLFPYSHLANIRIFYVLSFLSSMYFITGNWIFFWLRFMTYGQLGILDSLAFTFGFFMEVPTGAIADSIGRKKTVAAAFITTGIGFLLISSGPSHVQVIVGFLIAQIGWAFYSGAGEALAYDSLKEHNQEDAFEEVIATSNMLGLIANVTGAVFGGFLFAWFWRLPHVFTGLAFAVGFLVALFLHEPHSHSRKFTLKAYLSQIQDGFKQLLLPSIKPYLPLILTSTGISFMYMAGLIQPALAQKFGYDGTSFSFLSAVAISLAAVAVRYIPWFRKHLADEQGLQYLALFYIAVLLIVTLPLGYAGGIIMVLITIAGALSYPWVSVVINREIASEHRATALSAVEMIKKIPYIMIASIAGGLIDKHMLSHLCIGIAAVIAVVMVAQRQLIKKS